jgi:hypothetical protein
MGRGRAKAKQVKVARQLKYSGGGTDLDRLAAELGVSTERQDSDGHAGYADLDRYSADDEDAEDDSDDDDSVDEDTDDYRDEEWDSSSGDGSHEVSGMSRSRGR